MRALLVAVILVPLAPPVFAACYSTAVGDVPTQLAAQTARMLCQQDELKAMGDAQFAQLQLEARLRQQQILLEQQLRFQQQMAALDSTLSLP